MDHFKKITIAPLFLILATVAAHAQTSTFDEVYSILQTNCATAYCHGSAAGNLNLSGTKTDVYNALVNVVPDNDSAAAHGYSLIVPGYPRRSFLMKKINNGLDPENDITTGEGDPMPQGLAALPNEDIELIRQWILFGAPDTGTVVDAQLISDFYNGGGQTRFNPLPAPDPSEGFQVLVGPFFLEPHTEVEYSIKQQLFNIDAMEVIKMQAEMNEESHHFATFKYLPKRDTILPVGLRKIAGIADAAGVFYNSTIIAEWANSMILDLPEGTAFFWEDSSVIDFNYHIINTGDSILSAEVYINIYTQPSGIAEVEMKAAPIYYGGENVAALVIPNSGDTTFTMLQYDTDSSYTWNLWMIVAHTHALGTDFQVWARNADGTKGDHIYNGHYNESYTFDQGVFDWEHPPVRFIDPLYPVDMTKGLIHEATFTNNGADTVYFGLTTNDEMFVTYLLYTDRLPTGIDKVELEDSGIVVYPNPTQTQLIIELPQARNDARVEFYNLMGEKVTEQALTGIKTQIDLDLSSGIYLYRVFEGNELKGSSKLIIAR